MTNKPKHCRLFIAAKSQTLSQQALINQSEVDFTNEGWHVSKLPASRSSSLGPKPWPNMPRCSPSRQLRWTRILFWLIFALWMTAICGNISTHFNVYHNHHSLDQRGGTTANEGFSIFTMGFDSSQPFWLQIANNQKTRSSHPPTNEFSLQRKSFTGTTTTTILQQNSHGGSLRDVGFWLTEHAFLLRPEMTVHFMSLADGFLWISLCGIFMLLWKQRDNTELLAKSAWIEITLLLGKALAQSLTILPDANWNRHVCLNPAYLELHWWWILTRISWDFCGDMLYSGHTFHVVLFLLLLNNFVTSSRDGRERARPCVRYGECACSESPSASSHGLHQTVTTYNHPPHPPLYPYNSLLIARFVHIFSALFLLGFVSVLLIMKLHYSIDIVLAFFLTCLLYTHEKFAVFGCNYFTQPSFSSKSVNVQGFI